MSCAPCSALALRTCAASQAEHQPQTEIGARERLVIHVEPGLRRSQMRERPAELLPHPSIVSTHPNPMSS